MNKKLIRKIILISFILSTPLLLLSCKSNKKDDNNEENAEIEEEYYEYGINDEASSDPLSAKDEYPCTGFKVKNGSSSEQRIEVYYGFKKKLFNDLIFEGETSNYNDNIIYILNESNMNQQIKFSLYRVVYYIYGQNIKEKEEIYSFQKELGWFFNQNYNFEFKLENNKFVDTIMAESIKSSNENESYVLSYYYELTPVNGDYISLKAYCDTIENVEDFINERGVVEHPYYEFYNYPTKIISKSRLATFDISNNEISFRKR